MSNSKENENKLNNELLCAIKEKDIKKMRELIAIDADINGVSMITHYYWEGPNDSPDLSLMILFINLLSMRFSKNF